MSFIRQSKTQRRSTNNNAIRTFNNIHSIQALDDYKKAKASSTIPEDNIIVVDDKQYNDETETERKRYKPIKPTPIEEMDKVISEQSRCPLTKNETFDNEQYGNDKDNLKQYEQNETNETITENIYKLIILIIILCFLRTIYNYVNDTIKYRKHETTTITYK